MNSFNTIKFINVALVHNVATMYSEGSPRTLVVGGIPIIFFNKFTIFFKLLSFARYLYIHG